MDSNTIQNIVKETVKMKLIGIKVKESRTVKEVEERWNAKMQRGALHNIISYRDVYNARLGAGMTVSELNGAWNWLVEFNGSYVGRIIRRLSLAASIYLLWHKRNCRLFRGEKRSWEDLYKMFYDTLRMRLLSLKVKYSMAVVKARQDWDVNHIKNQWNSV
ncbi:hypothetical protein Tco_1302949 [Tanacetum coccineum]